MQTEAAVGQLPVLTAPWHSRVTRILRILLKKRLMTLGIIIILVIGISSALAGVIAPYGYAATDTNAVLQGPTLKHLFGTNSVGADTFSRVLYGGQVAFLVGGGVSIMAVGLALIGGMTSALIGGAYDLLWQRLVDAWLSIPWLIIVLTAVAAFGPSMETVILILGFSSSFGISRVVRGAVLKERSMTYVEAAQSMGAGRLRIAVRHVLPNILPVVIILATLSFAQAILAEAALSFLGWGVPPPKPSWGSMLGGEVQLYMYQQPWLGIFPGIALTATVWAVNVIGDGLRDILDPRLRGQGVS